MTPYHVARSKMFVRERFGKVALIHLDTAEIEANIEHTQFLIPGEKNSTQRRMILRVCFVRPI